MVKVFKVFNENEKKNKKNLFKNIVVKIHYYIWANKFCHLKSYFSFW